MRPQCESPIADSMLVDYWSRDLREASDNDVVEEHLFACAECTARLERLAAIAGGLTTLARDGHISGIVTRGLVNRLQRDGLRVRMFSLVPGETVPCAVFPDDDIIVTALRADLSGVSAVTLSVTGPGDSPFGYLDDVPVSAPDTEVLWATPAAVVRPLPSMRLQLTLRSAGDTGAELGRYVLEHEGAAPAPTV
jgi:hypothetical protein